MSPVPIMCRVGPTRHNGSTSIRAAPGAGTRSGACLSVAERQVASHTAEGLTPSSHLTDDLYITRAVRTAPPAFGKFPWREERTNWFFPRSARGCISPSLRRVFISFLTLSGTIECKYNIILSALDRCRHWRRWILRATGSGWRYLRMLTGSCLLRPNLDGVTFSSLKISDERCSGLRSVLIHTRRALQVKYAHHAQNCSCSSPSCAIRRKRAPELL